MPCVGFMDSMFCYTTIIFISLSLSAATAAELNGRTYKLMTTSGLSLRCNSFTVQTADSWYYCGKPCHDQECFKFGLDGDSCSSVCHSLHSSSQWGPGTLTELSCSMLTCLAIYDWLDIRGIVVECINIKVGLLQEEG